MLLTIRALSRRRLGQSAVEFALMAPVFFLLLVGTLDFGRAGFYYVVTSDLARTAARVGAAYDTGTGPTDATIASLLQPQARSMTFSTLTPPAASVPPTPPRPLPSCYRPTTRSPLLLT